MRSLFLAAIAFVFASAASAGGGDKSKSTSDAEAIQKRGTASKVYLAAAPVSATLTSGSRLSGLLQVDAGFDIPDDKLRARAASMAPVLRDAMREALTRYVAVFQRPGAVPDADRLKTMLQDAADKALGQKGARLVLVSVLVHDGR
jgi:flagellar basal body-associated protein FliL